MDPLVSTSWLAEHLGDDDLVVVDATVLAEPGVGFRNARPEWQASHIPGSVYVDLIDDFSDPDAAVPLMAPSPDAFAAAAGRHGIGHDARVVVYDSRFNMWAARMWMLLRAFGHDRCAVLDGGWTAWTAEGRPVTDAATDIAPATFEPRPRPELFADKDQVLAAIDRDSTCIIDALSAAEFRGETAGYGRAGHIPGAHNVPAQGVVDPDTQRYRPLEELRRQFAPALASESVVAYCGGGVAASSDALVLALLGHDEVAVYDGSKMEWSRDPDLPLVTDDPS